MPAATALFERVHPGYRWASSEAFARYLREILFGNPWRAADLPSWVSEKAGRVTGLAGIVPRPMVFRGRPIRAAVGCLFMVDPGERKSLLALQLLRNVLAGPQDLFLADGSNEEARRLWLATGGSAPLLYNLHWIRPVRPARHALSLLAGTGGMAASARVLHPLATLADALLARSRPNQFQQSDPRFTDETLGAAVLASNLPAFQRGRILHPVYDASALGWLLGQAALKTRHGRFRARAVLDERRQLAGWYLYYVRPGDVAEVLQLAARDGGCKPVLQCLLSDAWRHGATAIRGRLDPAYVQELSDRHCWLRREGAWTLIHSRHADIGAAFARGDAGFTRLDGEWWLRFLGG